MRPTRGRFGRNSSSPPLIVSKEPLGRRSLVEFGYAAGSSVAEMDPAEVETGERLLGKAKKDLRA